MALLEFTDSGLYCEQGDFFIDPLKPVKKALITHGHADHARQGSKAYLTHPMTKKIMHHRISEGLKIELMPFNEHKTINGVKVSFHPAGHIPGSAQIRLEHQGEVWCVSGDYKIQDDKVSEAFEPVRCDHFITESTFALPVFRWRKDDEIKTELINWIRENQEDNRTSILIVYALGKAQRVQNMLKEVDLNIYTHGAIQNMNQLLNPLYDLPSTTYLTDDVSQSDLKKALVLAPTSALGSPWMKRFKSKSIGIASGWMQLRGTRRRRNADKGFVLSDHADWNGLNKAIQLTGAENIYVTHGYLDIFTQWLNDQGYNAFKVEVNRNEHHLD